MNATTQFSGVSSPWGMRLGTAWAPLDRSMSRLPRKSLRVLESRTGWHHLHRGGIGRRAGNAHTFGGSMASDLPAQVRIMGRAKDALRDLEHIDRMPASANRD